MIKKKQRDAAVSSGNELFGGSMGKRLLASNFNVNSLRTNDVLLYDEWKEIDRVVLQAAQVRLRGVADLLGAGLTYNVDGLRKTVLGYQDAGDIEAAELSMDGLTKSRRDRPTYTTSYLPLPIIHKDFAMSARELNETRAGNQPLDTTMATLSARMVAEKAEELLFLGSSSFTFGGGTIYGYTDHPNRNTFTLSVQWDSSSATGETILQDVRDMKQAAINDRHYGPWIIYIPTNYETVMDDDFKANSDKTIRQRILEVEGVQDVRVSDKLTANEVIFVHLSADVVRMVEGLNITTVDWETEGGMQLNFKVMAILVPQIRADQNGRSGIIHGSV
jgi:uncharacterized linocin/CFP29 family protein